MSDINDYKVMSGNNDEARQEFLNAYKNYIVAIVRDTSQKKHTDQTYELRDKLMDVQNHLFEHQNKEWELQTAEYPSLSLWEVKKIALLDEDDALDNHLRSMDEYLVSHFSLGQHKDMENEAEWMNGVYYQYQRSNAVDIGSKGPKGGNINDIVDKDSLRAARGGLDAGRKAIKDADPFYIKSSTQYKEMKSAMEEFHKKGMEFFGDKEKGNISLEEAGKLLELADKAELKAKKYDTYKHNALNGKEPNSLERSRMAAADNAVKTARSVKQYVRESVLESVKGKPDEERLSAVETVVWKSGPADSRRLAEMIYLQTLRQTVKNGQAGDLDMALSYQTMDRNVETIMRTPAFKELEAKWNSIEPCSKELQTSVYRQYGELRKQTRGVEEAAVSEAPTKSKGKDTPEKKAPEPKNPLIS